MNLSLEVLDRELGACRTEPLMQVEPKFHPRVAVVLVSVYSVVTMPQRREQVRN